MESEAASGIVAFYAAWRARVESTTGWRMLGPERTAALGGMDFGGLGEDGRVQRVVGFFGPFPPG